MEYVKRVALYLAIFLVGTWSGFLIGTRFYPQVETITRTAEKSVPMRGEARTETKTEIVYVPKETVVERYMDEKTGQETLRSRREDTDFDARIGKADFNVNLNGRSIPFAKAEDEAFIFDKNKIALNQSSTITFEAKIEPPVIDETRRWGVGIGYGRDGIAYKLDFPLGGSSCFGGWIYKDGAQRTGGVEVKF